MSGFTDALLASRLSPASLRILLPWAAVALTLLLTLLSRPRLTARFGDPAGVWLYFLSFFVLLLAVPVLVVGLVEARPGRVLAALGLGPGNHRLGLAVTGIGLPVTLLISRFTSRTPEMGRQYPFARSACSSVRRFVVYEAGYLLLYYTAWEFLYRGLLFFPLVDSLGFAAAASITAALSTVYHIGHPDSEIAGALLGGFVFGAIALLTGSVLYSLAIHATLGISNDAMICLHRRRRGPGS